MEEKEILENLKVKSREIKNLRNLNSKDLKFKSWYAVTINLLKNLPSDYSKDVNTFKKLTFTDTKYHRGKIPYSPEDENRYNKDLAAADKILKKILISKKDTSKKPSS